MSATVIRLLLVEDNVGDARLIQEVLKDVATVGFDISFAATLKDALRQLNEQRFGAVLLDLSLPDGQGLDMVRRVVTAAPQTPTLVLTGLNDEQLALHALGAGAQDYIIKGTLDGAAIARAICFAIQRKGFLERIRLLRDIDQAIGSTLDLRQIFATLLDHIEPLFSVTAACVHRLDDAGVLQPLVARGLENHEPEPYGSESKALMDSGRRNGRPSFSITKLDPDKTVPPLLAAWEPDKGTRLQTALTVNNQPWGLLSLFFDGDRTFDNELTDILKTVIARVSVAVQNAQLYESVVNLADELRRSNKVKDEFLSIMSHELRTPLNVMMNCAEILRDGVVGEVTPEQTSILDRLLVQARNQLGLVNGILHVTRMETDKIELNYQALPLREFLEDLKADYSISFSNGQVDLLWEIPAELTVIQTDRDKVRQMLENLINNAIKFTSAGQIRVAASMPNPQWVEFKVSDTGSGMPEEALTTIFEKFQQLDTTATRAHGGVGIGLYLVKQFTDLLKGRVTVSSELGKGSCFTIILPSSPENDAGIEHRTVAPASPTPIR